MKILGIIVVLGIIGAIVNGCSHHDSTSSSSDTSSGYSDTTSTDAGTDTSTDTYAATDTSANTGMDTDTEFLTVLRSQDSYFSTVDDSTIIETAHSLCGALDRGATGQDVFSMTTTYISATDAGAFVGAAVAAYCPQYESTVENY